MLSISERRSRGLELVRTRRFTGADGRPSGRGEGGRFGEGDLMQPLAPARAGRGDMMVVSEM